MEGGFIEDFFLRGFIENIDKTYYELCVLYDSQKKKMCSLNSTPLKNFNKPFKKKKTLIRGFKYTKKVY